MPSFFAEKVEFNYTQFFKGGEEIPMLSLKLIPILWLAVVACNLFVKKFTPELSGWYPAYSGVVAIITLVGILLISCFQ